MADVATMRAFSSRSCTTSGAGPSGRAACEPRSAVRARAAAAAAESMSWSRGSFAQGSVCAAKFSTSAAVRVRLTHGQQLRIVCEMFDGLSTNLRKASALPALLSRR